MPSLTRLVTEVIPLIRRDKDKDGSRERMSLFIGKLYLTSVPPPLYQPGNQSLKVLHLPLVGFCSGPPKLLRLGLWSARSKSRATTIDH
ncbi:hypothetical protein U1Q18_017985 [Sarracenia purpurea var. burkii]